jgi:hypothetical protein
MGTKEEVIEFLKSEHDKYEVTYKTWCALNPGYIMHNDSIRIMVLENIISTIIKDLDYEDVIDYISRKQIFHEEQAQKMTGPHGHHVSSQYYKYLLNKITTPKGMTPIE